MGEVLSQNEIDSLLSALNSGEFDAEEMKDSGEKQVKNYDFAKIILEPWKSYLNTMGDYCRRIFLHIFGKISRWR